MLPEISPLAQQDIEEIATFSAGYGLENATKMIDLLVSEILKIAESPGLGHVREDLTGKGFRFWLVGKSFFIIYFVVDETIRVVRILHTSRDVQALLDSDDA